MLRIRELRNEHKFTQKEMADQLGVTQATFSGWETGKFEIDNENLIKIADIFNCSIDYILGVAKVEITNDNKNKYMVAVLGDVRAGFPMEAVENIIDYEEISEDMANSDYDYFALRIKGDSMKPRMTEGDVIIVRKQPDVDSGTVAVVLVNGDSATVKRVIKYDSGISLVATNPAYPPMFFTNDEIESKPVTVIGKVVELRAKF